MGNSLWMMCLLLLVDGATFSIFTTPLLLRFGRLHEPWIIACLGGAASATGSAVQLLVLRWLLSADHPWMRRFAPSQRKLEAAYRAYPSASFLALLLARATPLPDAPLKLVAAAVRYPVMRYALAVYLGALPYYFALAFVGGKFPIPTWVLVAATIAIVLGIAIDRWRRRAGTPA